MLDSGKYLFRELEHEQKRRFLKSHSHTAKRRGYQLAKESQEEKGNERRPIHKGPEKPPIIAEKHRHTTGRGGGVG